MVLVLGRLFFEYFLAKNRFIEHKLYSEMNIATYNIQSGGNSRLAIALKTMEMMNIDLGLFTETKLIKGLHTLGGYGYEVFATEAKNICT